MKPISLAALPHSRWAFDLDGVLAVKPPLSPKKWMHMGGAERAAYRAATLGWYRIAERLGLPDVHPVAILSARKDTPDVREATHDWLYGTELGDVPVHLLDIGRTVENAAAFKARWLVHYQADAFIEDNRAVLSAMARIQPATHLYFWDKDSPAAPELFYAPSPLL